MSSILFSLLVGSVLCNNANTPNLQHDSLTTKEIKEITVVGDMVKNLSFPLVVVNSKQLQTSSFFTPSDALQREPGISLARDGIWSTTINIRGLSEQRILEMVDGDRILTATDHAAAMSTVDMNQIDKIQVIKGAGSVLYGTGAMGGAVNFITKTPTYSTSLKTNGNLGTEFNTVNNLWANFADFQITTDKWYLLLNGSFRTAQNTMTPQGILPNSQFHDASWGVKAGVLYTPNQEFKANYQHFGGWDIGIPGGRPFPETAMARYVRIARNQLDGEYIISNISENLQKIRIKAYSQNISRDVELKPADPTITMLPGSVNTTSGLKAISEWKFPNYQYLIVGAEGWMRDAKTLRLTKKNSGDTLLTVTGDLPTPNAKMFDAGIFGHYAWEFVPQKWKLEAGVRLDYIQTVNDTAFSPYFKYTVKQNVQTAVPNLAQRILFPASVHSDPSYAAHIDLVYNPTVNNQFSLSIANSYRVASIEERFKLIELGGPKHVGNPNLKPEKGTFSNFGYRYITNNFRFNIDIFANYLSDLITEESGIYTYKNTNGITVSEQAFINENINKALFLGSELEAKWHINHAFSVLANASYTRARDLDANTFLPQIPPLHGFATINYENQQVGASFSALWAARQAEVAPSETTTDGHIIFNIDFHTNLFNSHTEQLQLFGGVENILNTAYFDHLSSTRGIVKLEPGRNIYLKIKYGW